jgi:hypothetical protein
MAYYMEEGRCIGMPVKIAPAAEAAELEVNGEFILRNTGDNDMYFLLDQPVTVTADNGLTLFAGETFPMILSGRTLKYIAALGTKAEVIKV